MTKTEVTIEQLFELGAHFGHRKRFWNPKMSEYIFCEKNNIHIINLYKTQEKIFELYEIFRNLSAVGNKIMIVGKGAGKSPTAASVISDILLDLSCLSIVEKASFN